jgi:glyoxalase family protein
VELVEHAADGRSVPWTKGPVGESYAVRGLHAVTLTEDDHEKTAGLFSDDLGFALVGESGNRARFAADGGTGGSGALVDLVSDPSAPRGLVSAGTVHHIAWRAPDDAAQEGWRDELVDQGLNVTQILDRNYFRSIYFREPGGVLLEIATDPPGFAVDEPLLELGRHLKLPPWLEPDRESIERKLPALRLPEAS